jgi:hypothetical protein
MAQNGFSEIISQLEQQKTAINRAIVALRGLDGVDGNAQADSAAPVVSATLKGRMTPEGKRRLVAALKKRWAAKKAAQGATAETPAPARTATKKKSPISAAGRERLAEAMKRRWAVKRAGSAVKTGRGKRAKAA